jgi:hypothetical protein
MYMYDDCLDDKILDLLSELEDAYEKEDGLLVSEPDTDPDESLLLQAISDRQEIEESLWKEVLDSFMKAVDSSPFADQSGGTADLSALMFVLKR